MKLYALLHVEKNKLVGFCVSSNDNADFCNDVEFSLETYSDNVWVTQDLQTAQYACENHTEWYNSTHDRPVNSYVGELKVVEFEDQQNEA